ncbi:MAG: RNA polymerase sigma factor [Solirubrobacteraceae bacterium]
MSDRVPLIGPPAAVGFRASTTLDESDETMRRVRRAIARAQDGDVDALHHLYVIYAHNVYGYVRSIVRDEYEAEDLTQQVFAKLMTAIVKYDDRGVPFFAWLLRLARNLAIDYRRANRMVPTEDPCGSQQIQDGRDPGRAHDLREALSALPDDQRQVVVLRQMAGLTPAEIAARIGRTPCSVHCLHYRGRRTMQQELRRLECMPSTMPVQPIAA